MKFTLPKTQYHSRFLENLLIERGIFDVERFLLPTAAELLPYNSLDNIKEAQDLLLSHLEDNILIVVDCDGDGYTSAAVMWLYLKDLKPDIKLEYILHTGKQHGLEDTWKEILEKDNVKLVILPDASSNDEKYHQQLKEANIDILVLDHHEAEGYSKYACVVNNQLSSNYTNKALSGVGVVYKFCQSLDERCNVKYADKYIDLVAVGEISDMMSVTTLENRYIFTAGLKSINNSGLKALIKKQEYSIGDITNLTPTHVAFYISPLINAIVRVGKQSEKEILFKSFICGDERIPSTKRGAPEGSTETIAEQNVRNCVNAKSRQKRAQEKALDFLQMEVCKNGLDENRVILIEVEDNAIESTLTGLCAMQLVSIYKRPVLVMRQDKDGFLKGSGRGIDAGELKDFKQFLNDSGYFDFAEGHAQAFGASIHKNNVDDFIAYANEKLKDVNFNEGIYEADFYFEPQNEELKEAIFSIGSHPEIWGKNNLEPIFAIDDVRLSFEDINICGKNSDTVRFTVNGVTFIKFNAKDFIEKVKGHRSFALQMVGRANLNEWAGSVTPQISIIDYNFRNLMLEF